MRLTRHASIRRVLAYRPAWPAPAAPEPRRRTAELDAAMAAAAFAEEGDADTARRLVADAARGDLERGGAGHGKEGGAGRRAGPGSAIPDLVSARRGCASAAATRVLVREPPGRLGVAVLCEGGGRHRGGDPPPPPPEAAGRALAFRAGLRWARSRP
jgi:hypothetical protein